MVRTHSKKKSEHHDRRVQRRATIAKAERKGWSFISKKQKSYRLARDPLDHDAATLSFRGANVSRRDIFLKIMTPAFLKTILVSIPPETWMLQGGKFFVPTLCLVYMYLAIYVRIQGKFNVPVQCRRNERPL